MFISVLPLVHHDTPLYERLYYKHLHVSIFLWKSVYKHLYINICILINKGICTYANNVTVCDVLDFVITRFVVNQFTQQAQVQLYWERRSMVAIKHVSWGSLLT